MQLNGVSAVVLLHYRTLKLSSFRQPIYFACCFTAQEFWNFSCGIFSASPGIS